MSKIQSEIALRKWVTAYKEDPQEAINHVKSLLEDPKCNVNSQDEDGYTALHLGCRDGSELIVKMLLGHPNIDVNIKDVFGLTPLCHAYGVNLKIFAMLLEHSDVDVNADEGNGFTLLHLASYEDDACMEHFEPILSVSYKNVNTEKCLRMLLRHPAINVNFVNKCGECPLHVACRNGLELVIKMLLGHPKIDVNVKDEDGRAPLHSACKYSNEGAVRILLNHPGVDVNCKDYKKRTPLHLACKYPNDNIVQLLLACLTIEVNCVDGVGDTPLHLACKYPNDNDSLSDNIVQLLLACPTIEVNCINGMGDTPLHLAWNYYKTGSQTISLLLNHPDSDIHLVDDLHTIIKKILPLLTCNRKFLEKIGIGSDIIKMVRTYGNILNSKHSFNTRILPRIQSQKYHIRFKPGSMGEKACKYNTLIRQGESFTPSSDVLDYFGATKETVAQKISKFLNS
jgi:ankyrin repeat protein